MPNNTNDETVWIASLSTPHPDLAAADRLGTLAAASLASTALTVAACRFFPTGTSSKTIFDYAASLAPRYKDRLVADPVCVAACIRTARGDHQFASLIDDSCLPALIGILIYAIMGDHEPPGGHDIDSFVTQVRQLTATGHRIG